MTGKQIPARVETLARAMCQSLNIEPDETFMHGAQFQIYPAFKPNYSAGEAMPDVAMYCPNWMKFVWPAHKWIFEHSGGELPETTRERC